MSGMGRGSRPRDSSCSPISSRRESTNRFTTEQCNFSKLHFICQFHLKINIDETVGVNGNIGDDNDESLKGGFHLTGGPR